MRKIALLALLLVSCVYAEEPRLGTLAFPNSGKPEAQPAFLRGVAYLHNFWYGEAAESFAEAQKVDPEFVLAYWGEAMAHNHPIWLEIEMEKGRDALKKLGATAADRAGKVKTPRERMYLEAIEILYAEGNTPKLARDEAYAAAMERLARAHPTDVEAQTFHALAILGTKLRDEPDARKQVRAAAILEPLYATHTEHPGVLHYLIHAYDDPIHAPLGLRAAAKYSKVAAGSPHAIHMPSHIFLQLGMWDDAARSNEQAYAVSKEWADREKHGRGAYDLHSLSWLQYIYHQQGRHDAAKKLLAELTPREGETRRERNTRNLMQIRYAAETNDWNAFDFSAPRPAAQQASTGGDAHAGCAAPTSMYAASGKEATFAAGMQAIARGNLDAAAEAAKELANKRTKESGFDARVTEVMQLELDGLVAYGRGKTDEALTHLAAASKLEDILGAPFGPPDTMKPAHELYADVLLKAGRKDEALAHYRASLARTPNRALSLAGVRAAQ